MGSRNKVARFRKRKNINIGVIVFLIIFVYVFICVYMYFTKDHLSIYEVKQGVTSDDNIFTGLVIRDEQVIYSNTAGYVNYYHKDGDRIAKNSIVYSIDESKYTYDQISNSEGLEKLTTDNIKELKKEIYTFQKAYNDNDFSRVYDYKYNLENIIMEIANNNMLSNLQDVLKTNGTSSTFKVIKSKDSGIITYSVDGLEGVTPEMVTKDDFDLNEYKKTQLRTMDIVESNSPIYKIVKSENWNMILPLNESQYAKLLKKESVRITIKEDGLTTDASVSVFKKGKLYFATLSLDKYMINYLNDRYLTIELAINSAEGLKIPVSSIVSKEFYMIPLNYFSVGGDSNSTGLNMVTYTKNGDVDYTFIPVDIYYSDETHGYVDARLFESGTFIHSEESGERYQVIKTKSFDGVFNVNKGYAIFRRIEVLYENEEYCIVKDDTKYGLSVYDHIALDGKTAVEQAIIY